MENHGLTDDKLREAYQRAQAARRAPDRERCATPEAMLAVIRREGAEEKRLETLDHVMACPACRAELDLLRSLEQAGAETEPAAAPRRRWGWTASVALAAALLLGIGAALKLSGRDDGGVVRGSGEAVTLVGPATEIEPGAPVTFSWQPVPGAARYELELLDDKGSVVFTKTTEATSAALDDTSRLAPGATYRWWVRAAVGSSEPRASSMRTLRLRAK